MITLVERYRRLLEEIDRYAIEADRNPTEISLIVVSKKHDWKEIAPLYVAGQRLFGESRLQELQRKVQEAPEDVEWHFIGPLQTNKVRKVVAICRCIHSVDSFDLAQKIASCALEAEKKQRILLQVNISGELTKQGITEQECEELFPLFLKLPAIEIIGLMTMAPLVPEDSSVVQECFLRLHLLRSRLQKHYGISLPHLSMGMSGDYPTAISEGATLLRIGTALFEA